jgi:hypothetical protein
MAAQQNNEHMRDGVTPSVGGMRDSVGEIVFMDTDEDDTDDEIDYPEDNEVPECTLEHLYENNFIEVLVGKTKAVNFPSGFMDELENNTEFEKWAVGVIESYDEFLTLQICEAMTLNMETEHRFPKTTDEFVEGVIEYMGTSCLEEFEEEFVDDFVKRYNKEYNKCVGDLMIFPTSLGNIISSYAKL